MGAWVSAWGGGGVCAPLTAEHLLALALLCPIPVPVLTEPQAREETGLTWEECSGGTGGSPQSPWQGELTLSGLQVRPPTPKS